MFIKMLKYDININWKPQAALIIAVLVLVLVTIPLNILNIALLNSLLIMLCVFVSIGVIFSYMVFHITGFYRTMVGGESYLTHTLPVSMNKIVLSKLVSALFWAVISISVVCLLWFSILQNSNVIISEVQDILINAVFMAASQFLCMMTLIGFCIGLSVHPMFSNIQSKILTSVISYIVIYYAVSFLQLAVMGIKLFLSGNLMIVISNQIDDAQAMVIVKDVFLSISVTYVVLAIIFYVLAVRIFNSKKSI